MCKTLGKSGRSTQIIIKTLKAPDMIFRYEGTEYWYTLVIVWKVCAQFFIIQLWYLGYLIFFNITLRLQALIGLPFASSAHTQQLLYLFSFPKYFHLLLSSKCDFWHSQAPWGMQYNFIYVENFVLLFVF